MTDSSSSLSALLTFDPPSQPNPSDQLVCGLPHPPPCLISVDEALQLWVGEFGPAQRLYFILASFLWITSSFHMLVTIFADRLPEWQCVDSLPLARLLRSSISSNGDCSSSSMCSMDHSLWKWVGGTRQSTVSEWGLICDNSYKVDLVQSLFFLGCLAGSGVFGVLSDSFLGRKRVLALCCFLSSVNSLVTSLAPNYWIYLFFRTMTGISSGGSGASGFLIVTELIGPSRRGPVAMSVFYFYALGVALLSGASYLLHSYSWRYLYLMNSFASAIYCFLVVPFLSESPRWYLVRGRATEALSVLRKLAIRNSRNIPESIALTIETRNWTCEKSALEPASKSHAAQETASSTILDIFRVSSTRKTMLIMTYNWMVSFVLYCGICLNVSNLGTNVYWSVLLNAMAETPGLLISTLLLGKLGRRVMLSAAFGLAGAMCLAGAAVSIGGGRAGMDEMKLVFGMLAMMGTAGSYNVLYVYSAELFPTVVRNGAMGLLNQAAFIGAAVAPSIVSLGYGHTSITFAIFALLAVPACLITFHVEETSDRPLYDSLESGRHPSAV